MKTASSEFISHLLSGQSTPTHLFKFEFPSGTKYWTEFPNNIFYNGQWYLSKGIRFDEIAYSSTPNVDYANLEIDNVNRWFSNLALSERLAFSPVWIWSVLLDNDLHVIDAILIFYGFYDTHIGSQKKMQARVADHRQSWKLPTPRRISAGPCHWTFKNCAHQIIGSDSNNYICIEDHIATPMNKPITGPDFWDFWIPGGTAGVTWIEGAEYHFGTCEYRGSETWCDQSWERCLALANTAHFGGDRWISYLADKEIWWGRGKNRSRM